MRRFYVSPLCIAAFFVFACAAWAGIFVRIQSPEDAVRVWKIHEEKGGAIVFGQVQSRETIRTTMPDLGEVEITALQIATLDYVGLRKDLGGSLKAYYLGGKHYQTSAQPADAATNPGIEAVFFLRPNEDSRFPGFWIDGSNSVVTAVKSASGETVLIGQGEGSVNPQNRKASEFMATHREAVIRVKGGK